MGHMVAPGTSPESYVLIEPFEVNKLTNDPEMYQFMIDQTLAHPDLGLGGPSLRWLYEALRECRDLARLPSPDLPCVTFLGSEEQIVTYRAFRTAWAAGPMANWKWSRAANTNC